MKKTAAVLLLAFPMMAADPPGFNLWSAGELHGFEKKLSGKTIATSPLARYGNHYAGMAHREGDGEAEWHETDADVLVIVSGSATLVVGGEIVEGRKTAPHEMRGRSISKGTAHTVSAGDIMHIPPKTPHQFLLRSGQITYFALKVAQ